MVPVEDFVRDGFVRITAAFSSALAARCRALLWDQMTPAEDDPGSRSRPVIRLGYQEGGPFAEAVNSAKLRAAFDAVVGQGRWEPRSSVGTFAVRFPSPDPPGDDGWHIDGSFPPPDPAQEDDPFAWRVNLASRGRALLLLMLFSEVGHDDAPTRLRIGSQGPTARLLAPYGLEGVSMLKASTAAAAVTADHPVALATGSAGDVYICHPFLIHAAQAHHGSRPRFLAQPPLHTPGWVNGSLDVGGGTAPVDRAIRLALEGRGRDKAH